MDSVFWGGGGNEKFAQKMSPQLKNVDLHCENTFFVFADAMLCVTSQKWSENSIYCLQRDGKMSFDLLCSGCVSFSI